MVFQQMIFFPNTNLVLSYYFKYFKNYVLFFFVSINNTELTNRLAHPVAKNVNE